MKYKKLFLTLAFGLFMFGGAFVANTDAQTRRVVRPVVVYRPIYARPYWGFNRYYYDPFYADMYRSPYERYLEERYYAQNSVQHDQKVLAKNRAKYAADGILTDKERRKLADDISDLQKSRQRLARLGRYY
jgi:hypothetical protein